MHVGPKLALAPAHENALPRFLGPACLAVLVALAFALRLSDVDHASLWADEVASWSFIQLSVSDLLGAMARVEPNPPGHYLLLKGWAAVFGDSEASLRMPSVIAGTLTVLPIAAIAARIGGPAAGIAAATVLALSAMHIHHAQQARGYALLFLAAATALWLLGRLLRPGGRWMGLVATTVGFAAACLAMIHLHATAMLTVAAVFGAAGVTVAARTAWRQSTDRRALLAVLAAGLLIALGTVWWLSRAIAIAGDPGAAINWIERPGPAEAAALMTDVLGGYYLGRLKFVAGGAMAVLVLAAAVMAVRRRSAEALGLAAGFALNFAALYGLSQVKPMLLDRTALVLLVFALPLVGYVLAGLRPRALGIALGVLLVAMALRGATVRAGEFARTGFGEDWRGAVAALARQAAPGDLVILLNPPDAGAVPYYAPGLADRVRVRPIVAPVDRMGAELLARLPFLRPLGPTEGCGGSAWTLSRETRWELRRVADWPPSDTAQRFGHIVLRQRMLPPCPA